MNKYIWIVIILAIIMAVLAGIVLFLPAKKIPQPGISVIEVTSPKANEEISSPLKITGSVNTGANPGVKSGGWGGFEGQVGTVKLLDNNGNQLGQAAILVAITDWMQPYVNFEATLNFISPAAQLGTLVFYNENPSGLPVNDKKFVLQVKLKTTSTVKIYFNKPGHADPEPACNAAFAVEREIPQTVAVARATLEELLKGPTEAEKSAGFFTSINSGVKIQSLTIENETAKVDFNEQLEFQVGGSCKVSAIRAQITETLKQFSTVKNVIISINGRTEDILQP